MSRLSALPDAISQTLTLGGTLGEGLAGAKVVYDTCEEWREKNNWLKQNQLCFY